MGFGDDVSVAASGIAMAAAAYAVGRTGIEQYRRTLGARHQLRRRIDSIACGVTTGYVDGLFGAPAFQRDLPQNPTFRERIYRIRYAWLTTWSTPDEAVQVMSVTATDSRFKLPTGHLSVGNLTVTLGHSRFGEIPVEPQGRRLEVGERRREYAEYFYFGNAGYHQHYVLSHNDAGVGDAPVAQLQEAGVSTFVEGRFPARLPSDTALPAQHGAALEEFRARTTVNTLTVGAAHLPLSDVAGDWIGVDADHVRALRPQTRA